jgi:hypothetical protein
MDGISMNRARWAALSSALLLFSSLLLAAGTQPTTIRGVVEKVAHPGGTETHVWLKDGGAIQEVCLGNERFLKERGFTLKLGEIIEVTGRYKDHLFVADSLSAEGRTLNLQFRGRYLR